MDSKYTINKNGLLIIDTNGDAPSIRSALTRRLQKIIEDAGTAIKVVYYPDRDIWMTNDNRYLIAQGDSKKYGVSKSLVIDALEQNGITYTDAKENAYA